ncbi:MAG: adenosylcobinamide-phosphate synthase CbiB [Rikenellaceae bacterium]
MEIIEPQIIIILVGALLDTLVGDPYWMPHPIRLFGNLISFFERKLNSGGQRRVKGGITWLTLCSLTWLSFWAIERFLIGEHIIAGVVWGSLFLFFGVSNRCLIEEGLKVERVLISGDIVAARKQLSMIVGRETDRLTPTQIRSSVVETLSENLSDGVVAPLLYFAIGGVPLMMLYKMVNTLDSMVGYKSERYREFGFISAKMDDLANLIPARLTAMMMAICSLSWRALVHIFRYAKCHTSPNSGFPESALSGVLDCRLGGPNYYFGKIVDKPYIGVNPRELEHRDVVRCVVLNAKVAALSFLLLLLWRYFI